MKPVQCLENKSREGKFRTVRQNREGDHVSGQNRRQKGSRFKGSKHRRLQKRGSGDKMVMS